MNTKHNKRISLLLAFLLLLTFLCSCQNQTANNKSLREHGLDVIRLMDEMIKNDTYGNLFMDSGNSALTEVRGRLSDGDYNTPQQIYEISVPSMQEILSLADEADAMDGLSESLKKYLGNRSASTLFSQLNAQEGASTLAVASIYTAGKTFVYSDLKADTNYLYTFQNGYPIAVSFTVGEDGAVSAAGTFILNEAFRENSPEQINEFFREFNISCTITPLDE